MTKYLKRFDTHSQYEEYINENDAVLPNVSICDDNIDHVHYNPVAKPIKAIKFSCDGSNGVYLEDEWATYNPNLEYSYDGKNWTTWNYSTLDFGEDEGDVYIRGNNPEGFGNCYGSGQFGYQFAFTGGNDVYCTGNIMHLISYEEDITSLKNITGFAGLFQNCGSLVEAPELTATELDVDDHDNNFNCYHQLFYNCSNLRKITMLAEDFPVDEYGQLYSVFGDWVYGVPSEGTFYCASGMVDKIKSVSNGELDNWTFIEV